MAEMTDLGGLTKKAMNYMENQFTRWFNSNSGVNAVKKVMVVPCDPEDEATYWPLAIEGGDFFKNCQWGIALHKDDYYILQLFSNDREFFIYWNKGFEYKDSTHMYTGVVEDDCHFLSHLVFYTEFNIQPSGQLNLILTGEYVFEEELTQLLPKLLTLSLEKQYTNEKHELKIIRVLLHVELLDKKHEAIHDKILELALSLPEENHDWLYFELIRAIRAKKQDSMFLCLYKILEFFFPLKNVFSFSERIKFAGSPIQLLEHCRNELNWNVNHNYGLRAAKEYASHNFCSYLGIDTSGLEVLPEDERTKKIGQLKSDGLEKLALLRHSLTHQNFKDSDIKEEEISKSITAIIIFLTESFKEYAQILAK
jgi:hypothetical protein